MMTNNPIIRYLALGLAWVCLVLGCIGIFVPVLPTTPFLLLTVFLFAKFSPRLHAWMMTTKPYQSYVEPFKRQGGISRAKKTRILVISYTVLLISALAVKKPHVWIILGLVALFLLWLMVVRIPTIEESVGKEGLTEKSDTPMAGESKVPETLATSEASAHAPSNPNQE